MPSTRSTRGASAESNQDDAKAASVSRGKVTISNKRKRELENDANKAKRYERVIGSVAEEYLCPITKELPVDPVTAEDGRIYERSAIEKHIEKQGRNLKSPATNEPMGPRLLPAVQVRNSIKTLVESGTIDEALAVEWRKRIEIDEKVKETRMKAEEGDTKAMCYLGYWYSEGEMGLPEDHERAYEWFKKASDLHSVRGMAEHGLCLVHKFGVKESATYGISLVSVAAGMGSDMGAYFMGKWHMYGDHDLPVDKAKAKYWLRKVTDGSCGVKHLWKGGVEEAKEMLGKLEADS